MNEGLRTGVTRPFQATMDGRTGLHTVNPGWTRRLTGFAVATLLVLATLLLSCPAAAYDKFGHVYTIIAVMNNLLPKMGTDESALVSFCAQLPDETIELDAVR